MVQYILTAAAEAAAILNVDRELSEKWKSHIDSLPDYPTAEVNGQTLVVDVQDAPPVEYNITVPSTPVFPGDVVHWWSSPEQKALFTNTIELIKWNGNNSMCMLAVAPRPAFDARHARLAGN